MRTDLESKRASNAAYRASKDPVVLAHADCKARAFRGRRRGWKEDAAWWRIPVEVYATLVGVCCYCGDPAMGLVRCDLSGVWRPSNVVCCCGRCGKGKAGLSHAEYLEHLNRVVVHLSSS